MNDLTESMRQERTMLSEQIERVSTLSKSRPQSGAEITLALRGLQVARMWLGVAEAMENGINPWVSQIPEVPETK